MANTSLIDTSSRSISWHEGVFTLQQAQRALRYVARVMHDAVEAYHLAQQVRAKLAQRHAAVHVKSLEAQRDDAIAQLNRTIDECHAVGVTMIDIPHGMVAMHVQDRTLDVCVFWRVGQSVDDAWNDLAVMRRHYERVRPSLVHAARNGCTSPI